jgi:hypothetical protein
MEIAMGKPGQDNASTDKLLENQDYRQAPSVGCRSQSTNAGPHHDLDSYLGLCHGFLAQRYALESPIDQINKANKKAEAA